MGEDKTARDEMVALTNQRGVPVIVIDDQVIIGFDQQKIEDALPLKAGHSEEEIVLCQYNVVVRYLF